MRLLLLISITHIFAQVCRTDFDCLVTHKCWKMSANSYGICVDKSFVKYLSGLGGNFEPEPTVTGCFSKFECSFDQECVKIKNSVYGVCVNKRDLKKDYPHYLGIPGAEDDLWGNSIAGLRSKNKNRLRTCYFDTDCRIGEFCAKLPYNLEGFCVKEY